MFGTIPATRTGVGTETFKTTTAMYSAGAGYTIGEDFFLKLEYTMVPKVGEEGDSDDDLGIDLDIDMISLGFQYRF